LILDPESIVALSKGQNPIKDRILTSFVGFGVDGRNICIDRSYLGEI